MIEEFANCLTKYVAKKFLSNYQWNNIFTNSKENIFYTLEDCDDEIVRNVKILFNDDTIDELTSLLDKNCGFGFHDLIKEKLKEKAFQLDRY